jgi:hypothetical protein
MGEGWLDDPSPLPRSDIRKPGAQRPVWVWAVEDLEAFIRSRRVEPGMPSPFG